MPEKSVGGAVTTAAAESAAVTGPRPRPSVSIILITYNEEDRLARTLESVRWADEIIVVDSGSTDRTEEVARCFTDRFHVRPWEGYGKQKQNAFDLASGEWVLSVDADEVVTPELRQAISHAVRQPGDAVGFTLELHTLFFGQWFGRRGWRRQRKLRLFRRDRVRLDPSLVHEGVEIDGPVRHLPGLLLHYHYRDLSHEVEKINRYSTLSARQQHEQGKRSSIAAPVVRGAGYFCKSYLLHGGFLYGKAGLLEAGLNGFYGFLKYAKLWELHRTGGKSGE